MILKKFIGKTIDAAKKSAQQMYGDDFVVLDSNDGNGKGQITVAVDEEKSRKRQQADAGNSQNGAEKTTSGEGVRFERTFQNPEQSAPDSEKKEKPVSSNLERLRRYAEKNESLNGKNITTNGASLPSASSPEKNIGESKTAFQPGGSGSNKSSSSGLYSRASARMTTPFRPSADDEKKKPAKPAPQPDSAADGQQTDDVKKTEKTESADPISRFQNSGPKIKRTTNVPSSQSRREEREITALHKRFDKLEALLDSSLISANLDYASHPAFQQLVQTGISTSVVAGWFSDIIKEGIDPYEQTAMFMSKLSGVIRDAIRCETDRPTQKFLLFAGPAGAGKTHMIMKLTQHPDFMKKKRIAVVSVEKQAGGNAPYYTILKPFCEDHNLPFYSVKTGVDVTEMQYEWEQYDHVLIDSPAMSTQQDNSFRQYWKIRQVLASLKPLEVHYVVNASLNKFYFRESSAVNHPLQPDYIAITHLDEVSQWGPVLPFMKEMGCPARYVSNGETLPDSLQKFNATWFAQRVLKN